ncbi:MAG TPA: prenyltransferase/squalene oxidase repeat-containing protein [Thermoplasmata archaeon]|nr:prenyltransferase/squalene oxidase repeat-containing protein [Thermoplasmata archaeon]
MKATPKLLRWLIGSGSDPSVRARYWREIAQVEEGHPGLRKAVREIGRTGWAADLLRWQGTEGQWAARGTSAFELYRPKYIATNWIAIVLADLGMTRSDPRIRRAAGLLLNRWSRKGGDLDGRSGEICITGNAVRVLLRFGYLDHPVVQRSIAWIVGAQKRDGGWHCFPSSKGTLDGWEGLAALAEIPLASRDASVRTAIERGAEFYLKRHLSEEGPARYPPWFRIHYPNHYYYDLLVGLRVLTKLGYGPDRRLRPALRWLKEKRRTDGSWALDAAHPDLDRKLAGYSLRGMIFPAMLEPVGEPSRWATIEALSVLSRIDST